MTRHLTLWLVAAAACGACVLAPAPVSAQFAERTQPVALVEASAVPQADVHGVVLDDRGEPLAGAVVSVFGSVTAFAVSDRHGRFALRNLPHGPYLMRAHLQGYLPPRARLVQVSGGSQTVSAVALVRRADGNEALPVLAAGVGAPEFPPAVAEGETESHDHGEVAWRLRHLKRGVLKSAAPEVIADALRDDWFMAEPLAGLGRAVGVPARLASALFAEVPWNGQIDLLTSASFDRAQDLLSTQAWAPLGVAFLSLEVPTENGEWSMRGAVTQNNLSSWILAGSYRRAPAAHRYEAGLSYGVQRLLGGGIDGRAPLSDGGRAVGSVYAYDDWTVTRRFTLSYGAKYARHDYLADQGAFSPRASVTVTPTSDATFKLSATASRRVLAPGAEEFIPPASGLWLPLERTFSSASQWRGLSSERVDHLEVAAEREWIDGVVVGVRAFRQHVDDQFVTVFGIGLPGAPAASASHYYVASAGDFEARGWGLGVSRTMAARLRASVDYTNIASTWRGGSPDAAALSLLALSVPAAGRERDRLHDVTLLVDGTLPASETHLFVIYKIGAGFSDLDGAAARARARFDLQVSQALPFVGLVGGEWELLLGVRSLSREGLAEASVYDELLVVRAPKRVVGGVAVRF